MSEKLPPTEDPRCGTNPGYQAHRKRGEDPCQPCKDTEAERARQRYQKDPEKSKKRTRAYLVKNPDKARAAVARWREKNREYDLERTRQYHREHPEKRSEWNNRRRARRLGNGFEPYTEQQVLDMYGIDCHLCGEPIDLEAGRQIGKVGWEKGLHIDHLLPMAKGGPDTLENVRPSHGKCNLLKGTTVQENEEALP